MLWDRVETNGYGSRARPPYPHTPRHRSAVGAVGDPRSRVPAPGGGPPGRRGHIPTWHRPEVVGEHVLGITPIPQDPWRASAYFLWDTGSPLSPLENLPPREGHDPHDDTPKIPAVQALKDGFWHRRGLVQDVCLGAPCTGPQF